jgi:hypothetical protein
LEDSLEYCVKREGAEKKEQMALRQPRKRGSEGTGDTFFGTLSHHVAFPSGNPKVLAVQL